MWGWGLEIEGKPPRVLGLGGAILINLNGVVGAGIFALPALLYATVGTLAPLAILVYAAFYAVLMAVPSKLSTVFRQSGGPQLYAQHAFGPLVGFQIGWFALCANMAGRAANFHVLVAYLAAVFPFFEGPIIRPGTILVLIAAFTILTMSGTKLSVRALGLGTVLKLGPILTLCLVGLFANGMPSEFVLPQFSEGEATALLLAYAFSGAGQVTVAAGEAKEPRAVISRSIYLNLAIVGVFYALVQLAYISISPDPNETASPLAAAGSALFGPFGALMISIAAIFSIGANQLTSFVTMPRIAFGMGRRGLLPNAFAYVSPRFKTPIFAIAVYSLIVAGLSVSGTFEILAILVVAVEQLVGYTLIASLIVMWRRNDGGIADTMGMRWAFIIPVAIGFMAWFTMQVPVEALLSSTLLVVVGIVLYRISSNGAVEHEPIILPEGRS